MHYNGLVVRDDFSDVSKLYAYIYVIECRLDFECCWQQ